MKKLEKAQMGKIVKSAVKTSKPVFKKGSGALAAGTAGLLGGVGYIKYKIDRGSVKTKSDTTSTKKKTGGSITAKKK